ncbi:MAG: AMP-binding protein [Halioglobus sp.]|nr:AMP-binding protein [Halioglobus sp.]
MPSASSLNLYTTYRSRFPDPARCLLTTPDGIAYTYADAERESARIANALMALGLARGDRVSVQVDKSPQALWLFLGTIRAGLVFHPLNTAYTEKELRYFLQDAGSAVLVCDSRRADALSTLCAALGTSHVFTLDADGTGSLTERLAGVSATCVTAATAPEDTAALVYSSGTTGKPKGIMLSHDNLVANVTTLVDQWGFTGKDCLLHALPIFHVHGLFVAIGCVLMSGSAMRWLRGFAVDAVLAALPHSTVMMGVPTYYARLLGNPAFDKAVCDHMRLFISGSAPLLAETFVEFEQRTGHTILERYGMTETGMNTSNPLHGERRAGTVGSALPGVAVRICDGQDRPLPAGAVGELQVKGINVFTGYWKLPEKTAADFTEDGFFRTGDQASRDADGYVAIVGRSKDMVISGGLNVYPREVEQLIDALPGVRESAVIGLPDADFGEIVAAVVVPVVGQVVDGERIRLALRQQAAAFKVPKKVFIVDELPRNAMGKVQKQALRDAYRSA